MNETKKSLQLGQIILKNFRTYRGETIIELSRDLEKTISIIHGGMGQGKTTILNAIYWCLYGESHSTIDSGESVLNIDVVNALNEGDFNETSVEISLYENDELRYKISRIMEFSKKYESSDLVPNTSIGGRLSKGIELNEKIAFSYLPQRENSNWITHDNTAEVKDAINNIFPKSLSKYFLFDAELLGNFFTTSDGVKEGIEKISGLPIIDKAIKHLKLTSKDILSHVNDINTEPIKEEVSLLERKLDDLEKKITGEYKKLNDFQRQIDTIQSFLRTHNEDTIKNTEKQIEELAKDIKDNKKRMLEHNTKMKNWILDCNVKIRLNEAMKKSMNKCNVWEKEGKIPIAVSGLALKNILNGNPPICICGAHLDEGSEGKQHIKTLLEKNLTDSPVIQNITSGRGHWGNMTEQIQSIPDDLRQRRSLRDEFYNIHKGKDDRKKALEQEFENVDEEEIKRKFKELKKLQAQHASSIKTISRLEYDKEKTQRESESKERELKMTMAKSGKHKSQINRANLANTLEAIFKKYRDDLINELREMVAEKMTDYFLNIVPKKEDFSKIEIKIDYQTVALGNDNGSPKELSAGQSCCLALSYIAAIRNIAEKNYFMMIDSPFHNISQGERVVIAKNLPKFLPQTQITLLVQDQEYTGRANRDIKGGEIPSVRKTLMDTASVWKEYLLSTNEEEGKTSYTTISEVDLDEQ